MSFQQGLSGLNTSSKALDVIGNNIANSSTVGFKSAETHFADVYANSLSGSGASQVGIGSSISGIQQAFSQGNVTATNNPLDISINGNGFFRMSSSGAITYTRNGQFHLDNAGYIINDQGMRLTGYQANAQGVILPSSPVDIQLSASQIAPRATSDPLAGNVTAALNLDSRQGAPSGLDVTAVVTAAAQATGVAASASAADIPTLVAAVTAVRDSYGAGTPERAAADSVLNAVNTAVAATGATVASVAAAANSSATQTAAIAAGQTAPSAIASVTAGFDFEDPTTYNYSTALSVYDTLGVAHTMTLFFQRTAAGGDWNVFATMDGATPQRVGTGPLTFNTSGALTTAMPLTLPSWHLTSGATPGTATWSPGAINFNGTTHYGSASSVDRITQGGFTTGSLSGLSVGSDGVVIGRYSNGQARNLGQVVLATFANPNGLQSLGNNQWALSSVSGPELVSAPGTGGRGVLQSSSIEESNVDLTAQLVNMITQQRNYQASAQTIKTQDSIMQTLVNLR